MTTVRRKTTQRPQPVGLPGSKPASETMHHYTVVFRGCAAKPDRSPVQERSAFVTERVRKTEADLKALKALVTREHLQGELGKFGEPTAFGMVELVATPRLAARLERASRVKAVIAD